MTLTSVIAGIVLALPALALVRIYARSVAQGYPCTDPDAATRLVGILKRIEAPDSFGVIVQSHTSAPVLLRRRPTPTLIFALSFIQTQDDDVLRGAIALQLSELDDAHVRSYSNKWRNVFWIVFAVAAGSSVILTHRNPGPFATFGAVGLWTWSVTALGAAWSRRPTTADLLARVDIAAAQRLGDSRPVQRALSAMAEWRINTRASLNLFGRICERLQQPVLAEWHETARAARLGNYSPAESNTLTA